MDTATLALINKLIDIAFAAMDGLASANVNYQEVIDAQQRARDEFENGLRDSPELNADERQVFIDQARAAVSRN